jgi:hypothetical protein
MNNFRRNFINGLLAAVLLYFRLLVFEIFDSGAYQVI